LRIISCLINIRVKHIWNGKINGGKKIEGIINMLKTFQIQALNQMKNLKKQVKITIGILVS
jgi:hypothetical protein